MPFQKAGSAATKLFLHALAGEIQGVVQNKFGKNPVFVGTIDHEGGSSVIRVWDFNDLLRVPPSVDCDEPWVMKEESWHYEIRRSRFCWVLQQEWEKYFADQKKAKTPFNVMTKDAAKWLVGAMRYVLSRHWSGDKLAMGKDWPEEWEDYSHGDEGVREFLEGTFRKP